MGDEVGRGLLPGAPMLGQELGMEMKDIFWSSSHLVFCHPWSWHHVGKEHPAG